MLVDTALLKCYIWMEAHEKEKLDLLRASTASDDRVGEDASHMTGVPDVADVDNGDPLDEAVAATVLSVVGDVGEKGMVPHATIGPHSTC